MDPTTSDGLTEGEEGDCTINWEELEAMYPGTSMCQDDCREGILPPTTPELHPVPSPLDAMLDECEADANTVPDASPVTELRILQEPGVLEQEPATLESDTLPLQQAQLSPQQAESSLPPADTLPPGPTYSSSSETLPLPGPHTGYSLTSLSEEAGEVDNTTKEDTPAEIDNTIKEDAPAEVDDTVTEADSTGVTINPELNIGTSPMETE